MRTNDKKLSKVESLLDFGRRLSLPISQLATFSYLIKLLQYIKYVDYVTREKNIEILIDKSSRPWRRPPEPRRTLQFDGPEPLYQTIRRRSVWADMHGHLWMASLLHSGGCGRCCSAICDRAVMQRLAHGWSCYSHHDRPFVTTRWSAYAPRRPHPIGRLNQITGQILACQPRLRIRKWDVKSPTADIVAALEWRLSNLWHHENVVDD